MEELVNRVAASGIITLNLEAYFPEGELAHFDLKAHLFRGLILREKDFREAIQSHDWSQYRGKNLLVYCTADAIIPVWAYMLVAVHATPFAREVFQGDAAQYYTHAFLRALDTLDMADFAGKRVVVKGCSDRPVPPAAYVDIARRLQPVALSVMYGEPCSTVPLYKQKKGQE